jgi:hypothetical protein
LINPDGSGTLVTKMADGAGGYKPGRLIVNKTQLIPQDRMRALSAKIERLGYWTLTEHERSPGLGGAQWVIEGVDHGNYRLVDRWTPKNGPVRELGLYFLHNLSALDLKGGPIY